MGIARRQWRNLKIYLKTIQNPKRVGVKYVEWRQILALQPSILTTVDPVGIRIEGKGIGETYLAHHQMQE
jgi:hypothetical protein